MRRESTRRCTGEWNTAVSGRIEAVGSSRWRAIRSRQQTFYFGSTGGGVWKTTDGGTVLAERLGRLLQARVGRGVAVAQSDPNVIYAGMGETTHSRQRLARRRRLQVDRRRKTWQHIGLEKTRNIGEIRIHPTNPDLVYVAAFGHVWGPNPERGVYRSTDGGKTWDERAVQVSDKAGAVDLSIDPNNPRILYAAIWEAERGPHFMSSGGEDSGLWRSTDGGDTWTEISRKPGMPKEGHARQDRRRGIARAGRARLRDRSSTRTAALFRSDDGGDTWTRGSDRPQPAHSAPGTTRTSTPTRTTPIPSGC